MIACESGHLVNRGRVLFKRALDQIREALPEAWSMEDLAATIQLVSENVARKYVRHWARETGHRNRGLWARSYPQRQHFRCRREPQTNRRQSSVP